MNRHVTFLRGRGGVYALGAIVANYRGDQSKRDLFIGLFLEVPIFLTSNHFTFLLVTPNSDKSSFSILIPRANN